VTALSPADLSALWVSLKLATITTACLLVLATPLAWWLAHSRSRLKPLVETVAALPLVLPPTVLGFYLLVLLGPEGPLGRLIAWLGGASLVFSFSGLVLGSAIYSLPFVLQPLHNAFALIGREPLEAAATLRAGPLDRFVSVALPLAQPGYIAAATLGFAHTLGEFGVVLMLGGNIPGRTQVLSTAIYNHVEAMDYRNAHLLSAGLLVFSCAVLLIVYTRGRNGWRTP